MAQNPLLSPEIQAIEREYARDVRIVEARPLLARIGVGFVLALDAVGIAFLLITVFGYVVSGSFSDIRAAAVTFGSGVQNFHAIARAGLPKDFTVSAAKVVQGTPTSYDYFAPISNPNSEWYATFTYVFSSNGGTTQTQEGAVLPGESTYLLSLGNALGSRPSNVAVSLDNVVWHRVDRHSAPDVVAWLSEHGAFAFSIPTYAADLQYGSARIGRTTFTITNVTPYAYWNAQYIVVLERAGAIVGISKATVSAFDAGDVRDVDVRWYEDVPLSATVTVIPAINYFDSSVYMPPRGTPGEDIRDSLK